MASLGPNAQKRYYQANSPSTTHLLSPVPSPSPQGVQAALAQSPRSVRSTTSDLSLVSLITTPNNLFSPHTFPFLVQNDSRYVSAKPSMPSISDKVRSFLTPLFSSQSSSSFTTVIPLSSHSHRTLPRGAQISLSITPKTTTIFTTQIQGETASTIRVAPSSQAVVSQT